MGMCEHGIERCVYCADLPEVGARVVSTWDPRIVGTVVGCGVLDEGAVTNERAGPYDQREETLVLLVQLDTPANSDFRGAGPHVRVACLRPDRVRELPK